MSVHVFVCVCVHVPVSEGSRLATATACLVAYIFFFAACVHYVFLAEHMTLGAVL